MRRGTESHDNWDERPEPDEEEDLYGRDDEEDEPTLPCPYCGKDIHEDSPRCPHCERYISEEDAPPTRKPWWILVGVVACLYAIYRWTVG
jgi:endogenous inhibitor of DNA gyrase (YacG/DUF329 family)